MDAGLDFLKSRVARRFSLLFILCAFVPTMVLIAITYQKVSNELEQQSLRRLKHEANAYGMALLDRMIRIDGELANIARLLGSAPPTQLDPAISTGLEALFTGIAVFRSGEALEPIMGKIDSTELQRVIGDADLDDEKPFVVTLSDRPHPGRVFFGVNGRNFRDEIGRASCRERV